MRTGAILCALSNVRSSQAGRNDEVDLIVTISVGAQFIAPCLTPGELERAQ